MKVEALKQTCSQAYPKSAMHVQEAVLQFTTILQIQQTLDSKSQTTKILEPALHRNAKSNPMPRTLNPT